MGAGYLTFRRCHRAPQRHSVPVEYGGVEVALHVVHALWHKLQSQLGVRVQVVQHRVPWDTVRVRRVRGTSGLVDGIALPLRDVVVSDLGVHDAVLGVACTVGDLCHGFDSDNSFQSQVGVVGDCAQEVVG